MGKAMEVALHVLALKTPSKKPNLLPACADTGAYQRVGEATEVALRVLAEKVAPARHPHESSPTLNPHARADTGAHQRVGEATKVALRVLAHNPSICLKP